MHEQFLSRQAQGEGLKKQAAAEAADTGTEFPTPRWTRPHLGFVAVAAGEGLKAIFTDLGADAVVTGGQTMNPSTADIWPPCKACPPKRCLCCPITKTSLWRPSRPRAWRTARSSVLPTRTIPQGITAMLELRPGGRRDENATNYEQAADKVATGLVTFAARDSDFDGRKIKKGEILALENGKLVATGTDVTKMTYRLARSMCKKDTNFITVISGCDVSEEDAARTTELVQAKCPAASKSHT